MAERNLKNSIIALFAHHHLLSAPEILSLLEGVGKSYNKTSVYRALDQLVADGVVRKLFFSENTALYELAEHHHAHVVCSSCGLVTEAECEYPDTANTQGFAISHHHVTLVGLCPNCQRISA